MKSMRRVEFKVCRECKELYRWESGGIIAAPQDHMDLGLCEKCRNKKAINSIKKIFGEKRS